MVDSQTLARTVLELATKPDADQHVDAFIAFLKKNNLMGMAPQVLNYINRLSAAKAEESVLHIYSKHELSDAEIANIQKVVGATDAPLQKHIDESVIGGFTATYNGRIYDGSLDHQVSRLSDMLTF